MSRHSTLLAAFTAIVLALAPGFDARAEADPLPSWNDGEAKRQIVEFVASVTRSGSSTFVTPADRVAVFDNDGTLWSEHPTYFQLLFALDRMKSMAEADPALASEQPYKAVLEGDQATLAAMDPHDLLPALVKSHAGMTDREFAAQVSQWLDRSRHPKTGRPYTEMVYQPMLELLDYLRANDFRVWIVSGGGVDFVREFAFEVYGVPPEQVVGSSVEKRFEMTPDGPIFHRLPEIHSLDDKEVKPVNIKLHIGKRPILAFGNSDGDVAMLQFTESKNDPWLSLLLHHDDDGRDYSKTAGTEMALELANERNWVIVYVSKDFSVVYPTTR